MAGTTRRSGGTGTKTAPAPEPAKTEDAKTEDAKTEDAKTEDAKIEQPERAEAAPTEALEASLKPEPTPPAENDKPESSGVDWGALLEAASFVDVRDKNRPAERAKVTVDPRIQAFVQRCLELKKKGELPLTDPSLFDGLKLQLQAAADVINKTPQVKPVYDVNDETKIVGATVTVNQRRGVAKKGIPASAPKLTVVADQPASNDTTFLAPSEDTKTE